MIELISHLKNLFSNSDPVALRRELLYGLQSMEVNVQSLGIWLSSRDDSWWKKTTESSRETSTHYKWFIFETMDGSYQLFLHEYKSKQLMRPGYALTAHNHRYWFTSKVLRGGFRHLKYLIPEVENNHFSPKQVAILEDIVLTAGDVYQVLLGEVHSLKEIEENTLTLVLQSKAERDSSEEFVLDEGTLVSHIPIQKRRNTLLVSLGL